jgi:hypothetical protein
MEAAIRWAAGRIVRAVTRSIATPLLFACAGGPTLEAHLAVDSNRLSSGEPRFTGCEGCPEVQYTLPTGVSKSTVVSIDPLYVIRPRDIDRLEIHESRSPDVLGVESFLVVAYPSASWESDTRTVRDSYPYDSIAWLDEGRLVVLTINVNRYSQGAYWLALFACENDAIEFAKRMGHPAPVIHETDEEYRTAVEETNARNAEMLELMRSNPDQFSSLPPSILNRFITEGLPPFPVPVDVYYGPDHELPKCEK